MKGPLAHQQSRRADRLLAAGKYEEAISCHKKAAGEYSFSEILSPKLQGNFFSLLSLNTSYNENHSNNDVLLPYVYKVDTIYLLEHQLALFFKCTGFPSSF